MITLLLHFATLLLESPAAADPATVTWGYEDCDKKAIVYPYPDDPHDGFPIGSCPPPKTLKLSCDGDSKIAAVDAEASTFETGYMHPPKYAIDAHMESRWSSHYKDPQWLTIDLGSVKSFERLYLVWELAHAAAYTVSTSDDKKSWKTVHKESKSDGYVDVIDAKAKAAFKGRYIKIEGTKRAKVNGESYGYSLFDVTICGKAPKK